MVTHVLDASAVLRFLDREAGYDRMKVILDEYSDKISLATIPAVQWGDVVGILAKRVRAGGDRSAIDQLRRLQLMVVPADAQRAERSSALKAAFALSYMDAFAVELTLTSPDDILIAADFDFKPAESQIQIEFLPQKPRP